MCADREVMAAMTGFLVSSDPSAAILARDCGNGNAPDAMLLCGPDGVGKRALALFLAKTLLCVSAGARPCCQCGSCRRFDSGNHPNVLAPQAPPQEKSVKVEHLRLLLSRLGEHAQEPGRRIVLLLNAETLTPQAQGALLKSLEEPQQDTYFILTASNGKALLPTVHSRCRTVRLSAWPEEALLRFLLARGIGEGRARELADVSEGRPGLALTLDADQRYWKARDAADGTFFRVERFDQIPAAAALLKDTKEDADLLLDIIEARLRVCLRAGSAADTALPASRAQWASAGLPALGRLMQAVFDARRYRASNTSWQALADRMLFLIAKEIHSCQWQ